jgi:hypothetical protein
VTALVRSRFFTQPVTALVTTLICECLFFFYSTSARMAPTPPTEPTWPRFDLRVEDLTHPGVSIFFQSVEPLTALRDAVVASFKWLYTPETAPTKSVSSFSMGPIISDVYSLLKRGVYSASTSIDARCRTHYGRSSEQGDILLP